MKVVFLTGSHPRHAYMARALATSSALAGLVIEQREAFIPPPPPGLSAATQALYIRHFAERDATEARFFGEARLPALTRHTVAMSELNTPQTVAFINRLAPDLVLSYGVHKLTADTLNGIACPLKWNIHGGLSPWYRGVITHFWPSYFLEPQMTGMTVHELTQDIDGGRLIHQSAAPLIAGDGLHALACRAVQALGEELAPLLATVEAGTLAPPQPQSSTGRIWRSQDWQAAHLHLVYDYYENRIVDHYIKGAFEQRAPRLVRQFQA